MHQHLSLLKDVRGCMTRFDPLTPEIVAKDDRLVAGGEGCLSVPEIYDDVERSQRITLRYYDSSFTPHEEVIEGFTAVIFQHEIDHLDGKLFIDYLK